MVISCFSRSLALITALLLPALMPPAARAAETVAVGSLDLSTSSCGWGSTRANRSINDKPLTLAGKLYESGIGHHAPGQVALVVGGKAERFTAIVGVDDGAGAAQGSVVFKVLGDGKELFASGVMKCGDAPKSVDVPLKGVSLVVLSAEDGGDGFNFDHADWADAKIVMSAGRPMPVAPQRAEAVIAAVRSPAQRFVLKSGSAELRLRQSSQGIDCEYFGPAGGAPTEAVYDLRYEQALRIEGRQIRPEDLAVVSAKESQPAPGCKRVEVVQKHALLPLEVRTTFCAWGDTGAISRQAILRNIGQRLLHIESAPSLHLPLPAGEYELTTLQGPWGAERQVVVEKLAGEKEFECTAGRSTARMSPWFVLKSAEGVSYAAQLAWSGNWNMRFIREDGDRLVAEMAERFDYDGAALLPPGESLELPAVAMACVRGDVDDAANALHRYQRQYVIPKNPANDPPLVQFNSWFPFPGKMEVQEMKKCVDVAAEMGAEIFVLDAGWYNKRNWEREVGDWHPDPVAFPKGTAELAQYAHGKGLKFGIWVEIENLGVDSDMAKAKAAEWCLKRDGKLIESAGRYHLDFGKPEVRAWARGEMDRLVREHDLDWVKIDYNISVGEKFDLEDGTRPGTVLHGHVRGYYQWLDELRAAHPKLIIENCSSGGLRFDLGMLAHTHTTWISDITPPWPSLQLAYGSTMEFTPGVCNHWMVGDRDNGTVLPGAAPEWWDVQFRVPMNGQFGVSSKIFEWPAELRQRAKENVALYKRLREVIAKGDCYHLTPPPAHQNPRGWMALQYVTVDASRATRSIVTVYRMAESDPKQLLKLRGLQPDQRYRVTREGADPQTLTGRQLADQGITIELPAPWRSTIMELQQE